MTSLLPSNASQHERALDQSFARITVLPVPIKSVWNAKTCPVHLLPWLAWSLSVDEWHSEWPEHIQRQVIANSIPVHFKKGTVGAVKTAIKNLGVSTEFSQWFEQTPKGVPYSFEITAWANENITPNADAILDQQLYTQLHNTISNTKNTRSSFTFKIGAQFGCDQLKVGSTVHAIQISRTQAQATALDIAVNNNLTIAATVRCHAITMLEMEIN